MSIQCDVDDMLDHVMSADTINDQIICVTMMMRFMNHIHILALLRTARFEKWVTKNRTHIVRSYHDEHIIQWWRHLLRNH